MHRGSAATWSQFHSLSPALHYIQIHHLHPSAIIDCHIFFYFNNHPHPSAIIDCHIFFYFNPQCSRTRTRWLSPSPPGYAPSSTCGGDSSHYVFALIVRAHALFVRACVKYHSAAFAPSRIRSQRSSLRMYLFSWRSWSSAPSPLLLTSVSSEAEAISSLTRT